MKLLADENIYREVIEFLRNLGHNVKDLRETNLCGISDEQLLQEAAKEKRILISQDRDFADIRFLPKKNPGIIVMRVKPAISKPIQRALEIFLKKIRPSEIKNTLVILEEDKFRIRRL